jgi:prephenate dehydratase
MDAAAIPDPSSVSTISFLGPAGTFTEEALFTQPDYVAAELVPAATLNEALEAVGNGAANLAFVPIENSIEGAVNATVDSLVFEVDLLIQREVVLDIHLHLAAQPGSDLGAITRVLSIPVASAQCRRYLAEHLPNAEIVATNSTAEAARIVSQEAQRGTAALAPLLAAELYGLEVIASNVEDHSDNQTRFVSLASSGCRLRAGTTRRASSAFNVRTGPGACTGFSANSQRAAST